jgi:hypothetical protein
VVVLDPETRQGVDALLTKGLAQGLPRPGESVRDFLTRKESFEFRRARGIIKAGDPCVNPMEQLSDDIDDAV